MPEYMKLIEICKGRKIYIQTHNFPDPDAIASAFGLQKLLAYYGIDSVLCYYGKIDKFSTSKMTELLHIKLYPYEEIVEEMTQEDYIICVDSQKSGGNILDFEGKEIACIDHHPTYAHAEYLYSDIRLVGSCSTLIAEAFDKLQIPMDCDTATALLYGLKIDTLQFSRGVTELDIRMFDYLFTRSDASKLALLEMSTMEFADLKAYGAALENIRVYGTTGFAKIPFPCPDSLIATISDFILKLKEIEVAIVYSYRENGIKFSVRSETFSVHAGDIACNALKDYGNGGGHAGMAGGFIPEEKVTLLGEYTDQVIMELFYNEINKYRNNAESSERK